MKGFGVRVTSGGTKAFFVEKLVHRKLRRITLGRYPELTVEMARKEAQKLLGQIATGIDPLAEKTAAKARRVTLKEVYEEYLLTRKSLKPKTKYDYERTLKNIFSDWNRLPLISITREKVSKLHTKIGNEHGEAYANLVMRVLRALFNFASQLVSMKTLKDARSSVTIQSSVYHKRAPGIASSVDKHLSNHMN